MLQAARRLGTRLIVGINSDASINQIKGIDRPFISENDRAAILRNLRFVDEVHIFEESTPENLIKLLKPDVLVKGGDWRISEIIGADFVQSYGGKVISIPLKSGYSSSSIVEKIRTQTSSKIEKQIGTNGTRDLIQSSIKSHLEVSEKLLAQEIENIEQCAELIEAVFKRGNKIMLCGNGGSAADAQHIAAEFVGRFETERKALPAVALTTDTSALTALANDYDFEKIFSRQVEALAVAGDLLIGISTSGNSPNVSRAVMTARRLKCQTLGLTGADGKKLAAICDECVLIPDTRTARIQEAHILIAHIWCEIIDAKFKL